jgi:hypothetical protein
MNGAVLFYSVTTISVGFLQLALGSYVLVKNPRFSLAQAFFATMLMGFHVEIFFFLLVGTADASIARYWGMLAIFFFTLMLGGYLFLSSQLPFENFDSPLWKYKFQYGAIIVLIGLLGAYLVDDVTSRSLGYWVIESQPMLFLMMISFSLALLSVHLLHKTYTLATNPEARQQCVLLAFGIFFPILYTGILQVLEPVLPGALVLGGLAYLVTILVFTFGILKFKMFIINPVVEDGILTELPNDTIPQVFGLPPCLLVEEKRPECSYDLFIRELSEGSQGLVISRSYPDSIREKYKLERTPIIWLANQPGQDRVEPGSLSILENMISDFVRKSEKAVVMIDGIEFLISNNKLEKVLKMLYSISDDITMGNARLILPIDPNVISESEIALFEREFEVFLPDDEDKRERAGTEI